jgi:predicted DNA binding protein
MPQAKLTVTVPERIWIGDLTRRYPDAVVRVLAAFTDEDAGVGLAEVESDTLGALLADLDSYEDVEALEILRQSATTALVQFETTMPLMLLPARDSGVPLEMPVEISDGTVEWELTAPRERLSGLADQLDNFDIRFRVEYVRDQLHDESLLTDRQRRLIAAAIEAGYYDTPRACSLTELADELDIAKSTASETLHRAEGAIIKEFFEGVEPERPQTTKV